MSTVTQLNDPAPEAAKRRTMHPEMRQALNSQLKAEFESSYRYLGIATYFEGRDLPGFARWFKEQAQEELEHAMKVYSFLCDRGADVELPGIAAVSSDFESPLAAFQAGLEHEQELSLRFQELYGLALQLREFDSASFLDWFLKEQIEEENLFGQIVARLKLGEENIGMTLLLLDSELGNRTSAS